MMKTHFRLTALALASLLVASCNGTKESGPSLPEFEINTSLEEVEQTLFSSFDADSIVLNKWLKTIDGHEYDINAECFNIEEAKYIYLFIKDEKGVYRYKDNFAHNQDTDYDLHTLVEGALTEKVTLKEYSIIYDNKKKEEEEEQRRLKEEFNSISEASYPSNPNAFQTADLKFCGLRGHVKEVRDEDNNVLMAFDKNGTLTRYNYIGDNYPRFKRNKKGQITTLTYNRWGDPESTLDVSIKYDNNGYLAETFDEAETNSSYTYSPKGYLLKLMKGSEEFGTEIVYRYAKFDKQGNPIEGIVTDGKVYQKDKRNILYY